MLGFIVVVHTTLLFVIGGDFEWNNFELVHAWCHFQDLCCQVSYCVHCIVSKSYPCAVGFLVDVQALDIWVTHTSWITANNVELSASDQTGLGVPLDLKNR